MLLLIFHSNVISNAKPDMSTPSKTYQEEFLKIPKGNQNAYIEEEQTTQ